MIELQVLRKENIKNLFFRQKITLTTIPPNIWNGFKNISDEESIIANCLDIHNEKW